jgi:hypothetical protein
VLRLSGDQRTLSIDLNAKRHWLKLDTRTWRLAHVTPGSFPWSWAIAGGAVLAFLALGAVWRRSGARLRLLPARA